MHRPASSASPEVSSECPCTGYCTTGLGDEVCRNCLRTFDEITRWVEMSDDERHAVNQRIALLPATPSNSPLSGGELDRSSDKGRLGGV